MENGDDYNLEALLDSYVEKVDIDRILEEIPETERPEKLPGYDAPFTAIYDFLVRVGPEEDKTVLKTQTGYQIVINCFKSTDLYRESAFSTPLLKRLYGIEIDEEGPGPTPNQVSQMLGRIAEATPEPEMEYEEVSSRNYKTGISKNSLRKIKEHQET